MKSFYPTLLLYVLLNSVSSAQEDRTTVISGATLIDGTGAPPVPGAVVIITGNRIRHVGTVASVKIPPNARLIDARGKFILPGLIDTHVHLEMVGLGDIGDLSAEWGTAEKLREIVAMNARLDLIAGFTTVRDLGSTPIVFNVREDINSGRIIGPCIVASGMQMVTKSIDPPTEPKFIEYDGRDSAESKVRYLASLGVEVIKIRLTHRRRMPSFEEVRAIVKEAHRLGLRVTAHTDVPADDLVLLAIRAGADGIEHNAPLRVQDGQVLLQMAQNKMSLMTGAGAFYVQRIDSTGLIDLRDESQRIIFPDEVLSALGAGIDTLHAQTERMKSTGWSASQRQARFIAEIERARKAGILLVFGTDCGAYGMIHGEQYKALYGESQMGSSSMETILMATRDAAEALGKLDECGTVQEGKRADLIIVDADPMADLRNLRHMFRVIKGGNVYDPGELMHMPNK